MIRTAIPSIRSNRKWMIAFAIGLLLGCAGLNMLRSHLVDAAVPGVSRILAVVPAISPEKPEGPNPLVSYYSGFIFGLNAGLGLLFLFILLNGNLYLCASVETLSVRSLAAAALLPDGEGLFIPATLSMIGTQAGSRMLAVRRGASASGRLLSASKPLTGIEICLLSVMGNHAGVNFSSAYYRYPAQCPDKNPSSWIGLRWNAIPTLWNLRPRSAEGTSSTRSL